MSKKFNPKVLTISLGLSAGVMIYVSIWLKYLLKARDSLSVTLGDKQGYIWTVISFFAGIFIIALIDKIIPSYENPHELNVARKN